MDQIKTQALLDLSRSMAGEFLAGFEYPWQALASISECIRRLGPTLDPALYDHPQADVWIAKTAVVYPSVYISGPCIIGPDTEVRHCAFIRGSVLVGAGAVIGNSVELKNAILFDGVQAPHYNYIGDSILGYRAHMGAGSITSNIKSDKSPVRIRAAFGTVETGLRKFGAILGDFVEVGAGSVLNPGTIIGRSSNIYPLSSVRGVVPPGHIFKGANSVVKKEID